MAMHKVYLYGERMKSTNAITLSRRRTADILARACIARFAEQPAEASGLMELMVMFLAQVCTSLMGRTSCNRNRKEYKYKIASLYLEQSARYILFIADDLEKGC